MFHNFPLKITSVVLAIFFWLFVVSLESVYIRLPADVPVTAFNKGEQVALTTPLPTIKLGVRTDDPLLERSLTAADFEAYIDLSSVGVGQHTLPISVTSRNARVSVVRVEPSEVTVTLEPVKQKIVLLTAKIIGQPSQGYAVRDVLSTPQSITISGAESVLRRVVRGEVNVEVQADVQQSFVAEQPPVNFFDSGNVKVDGVILGEQKINATVTVEKLNSTKQIGIQPTVIGSAPNMTIKAIIVEPALVTVEGTEEALGKLEKLTTTAIDISKAQKDLTRKISLELPVGVTLAKGTASTVTVTIQFEQTLP